MKIKVEIFDEEVIETAKSLVAERLAGKIYDEMLSLEKNLYRKAVKEVTRDVIKEHQDELIDRSVASAAKAIANKGVAKLLKEYTNGEID